jgi:predicted SAM-dependent methyltransferase
LTALAGAGIALDVLVRNESRVTWPGRVGNRAYPLRVGNHWLDESGRRLVLDDGRTDLPQDLAPGKEIVLPLDMRAPATPGKYLLELDMVQELIAWFADRGSPTTTIPVTVEPADVAAATDLTTPDEPVMEVHGVPHDEVADLITSGGGKLMDEIRDVGGIASGWVSYRYCVVKQKIAGTIRRLNWGCGKHTLPGWINCDRRSLPRVDLACDINDGLPLESDSIDYIASIHALPEVPYERMIPTLAELRRVLKPGGVLRLALPDLMKGVEAAVRGDREYFKIPDGDALDVRSKLVVQLIWYGYSRTLFTHEFIEEQLRKAGFERVDRCAFRETRSRFREIIDLDNRENESLFVEAVK